MTPRNKVKRHFTRAGNSIPVSAKRLKMGDGTFRKAIDAGQVKVINFGGLRRVPEYELQRVAALLGIELLPAKEEEAEEAEPPNTNAGVWCRPAPVITEGHPRLGRHRFPTTESTAPASPLSFSRERCSTYSPHFPPSSSSQA